MKHRVLKSIGRIAISGFVIVALILTAVPFGAALNVPAGSAGQSVAYGTSKKITVKFNGNGGTVSKAKKRVTIGKKYGTLPTAVRGGYAFKGWYSKKKSGGKKITKFSKVKRSYKTLYARWGAGAYTITFNANGGRASFASKAVKYRSAVGVLPTATKPEYFLAGWYTQAVGGTKVTPESIYTWKGNLTLYAHWIIKPPVHIYDMKMYDRNGMGENNGVPDNYETAHKCLVSGYRKGNYATYLLDSKYTTLNGVLFLSYLDRNTDKQMWLKIYKDNVLAYTSPVMGRNVRPISFSLDVRNVEQLKFEADSVGSSIPWCGIDATIGQL
jgi:uncharacterized repeat protein (TIGR02543 family)